MLGLRIIAEVEWVLPWKYQVLVQYACHTYQWSTGFSQAWDYEFLILWRILRFKWTSKLSLWHYEVLGWLKEHYNRDWVCYQVRK